MGFSSTKVTQFWHIAVSIGLGLLSGSPMLDLNSTTKAGLKSCYIFLHVHTFEISHCCLGNLFWINHVCKLTHSDQPNGRKCQSNAQSLRHRSENVYFCFNSRNILKDTYVRAIYHESEPSRAFHKIVFGRRPLGICGAMPAATQTETRKFTSLNVSVSRTTILC